jgi:hypothetical protein
MAQIPVDGRPTRAIDRAPIGADGIVAAAGSPAPPAFASAEPAKTPAGKAPSPFIVAVLGVALMIFGATLLYLFVRLWPAGVVRGADGVGLSVVPLFELVDVRIGLDMRLFMLVLVSGGLGAFVHTATSFGDFVGNEKLASSWTWWYFLRPFIGMVMAGIVYVVFRGGFLTAGPSSGEINLYGTVALACLVGMFSKQATDKLSEVFDTLFRTTVGGGDAKRKDDLQNPQPVVSDVQPKSLEPLTDKLTVSITGSGFVEGSVAQVNGSNRETIFLDATELSATLQPGDVAKEGELVLTVYSPGPGGGASTPIRITIAPSDVASAAAGATGVDDDALDCCMVHAESEDYTRDEDLPATEGGIG